VQSAAVPDVVYGDDVRMNQRSGGASLGQEQIDHVAVPGPRRQNLDRTGPVQRVVRGAKDPRHASLAQERIDGVSVERFADQIFAGRRHFRPGCILAAGERQIQVQGD